MAQLSDSVTRLVEEFAKLPGIGKKTAERLTYHVLRVSQTEALGLADAIRNVESFAVVAKLSACSKSCPAPSSPNCKR